MAPTISAIVIRTLPSKELIYVSLLWRYLKPPLQSHLCSHGRKETHKYLKITARISFAISKPHEQTNMASRSIGCVVRLRVRILTPNSRQRVEEFCSQEELAGATWQAMQRDLGCYLA